MNWINWPGLRKKTPAERERALGDFRSKYDSFKALQESNSELLDIIGDAEQKLQGREIFGAGYLLSLVTRTIFHAGRMVYNLDRLAEGRYGRLKRVYEEIARRINQQFQQRRDTRTRQWILPFTEIRSSMVDDVGGKSANLGEICSVLQLPIPDGFAITTSAYDAVLGAGDTQERIRRFKMQAAGVEPEHVLELSEKIQHLYMELPIPVEVEAAILAAFDRTAARSRRGDRLKIAMRSSAIGEDSHLSFAGQYQSFLNVGRGDILECYRRILASLFSPRAIAYRLQQGITSEDLAMGVACLEMIGGKASGVLYTRNPAGNPQERHRLVINAVWGLGPYAVDGRVTPDTYLVSTEDPARIVERRIARKAVMLVDQPEGGTTERPVNAADQERSCLSDDQILALAAIGRRLESHFNSPQDVEWVLDADDRLFVLQARPLEIHRGREIRLQPPVAGYEILLEGGDTACPGVGCGPVHAVLDDSDLLSFPEGGVLVAPHSMPKFVIVMHKACALLTDSGSITGHMATLAREFGLPTILNTQRATAQMAPGTLVTVDASSARVYRGRVAALLQPSEERRAFMLHTPIYHRLQQLTRLIVPLNLTDPDAPEFSPGGCRTIHDIMRLVHEVGYQEMFRISDRASDQVALSAKLLAPIPLDLYLIDLGGGLASDSVLKKRVCVEDIRSAPFAALLRGMLREDLRNRGPQPVHLGGLFAVMSRQLLSPPRMEIERFGDKSYAIITDEYMNFSSRVGYHFSILDAFCGNDPQRNYINFEFKGGAADKQRRNRRARLIQKVMTNMGFWVQVRGDRVTARFSKHPADQIVEKLDYLGRLLQFTRQMDMLMHTESSVNDLAECFLKEDYGLCHFSRDATGDGP
jgi:pyruvate,water dikinase